MATTIRLTRMGRKKRPFYRLVAVDSRKRRDGAYLANLGYYNPFNDPFEVELHTDEIISWLSKGATISGTARALLKGEGVLYRYSLVRQGLDAAEIDARMAEWLKTTEANKEKRAAEREAREAKAAAELKAKEEAELKAKEEAEAKAKAEAEAAAAAEAAEAEAAEAAEGAEEAAEAAADEDGEAKDADS